jgi:translocation and assembly module TamB
MAWPIHERRRGYAFATLVATARGPVTSPYVTARLERGRDDVPNVLAHASIQTGGGVTTVTGAEITLSREDVTMVTRVARLRSAGGVLVVEGLAVEGVGSPLEGSARLGPRALSLKARVEDIDLMRIARLFARTDLLRAGHARLDVDMTCERKSAKGRAFIGVKGASFGTVEGADAALTATIDGLRVTTLLDATLGDAGAAHIETKDLVLGGEIADARSWRTADGIVIIDSTLDLGKMQASLPPSALPFDRMAGVLTVKGSVTKRAAGALPDLDLAVSTRGLDLTGKSLPPPTELRGVVHPATATVASETVAGAVSSSPAAQTAPSTDASTHTETVVQVVEKPVTPPWHSVGVDLQATLLLDGAKGHTELTAKLVEKDGVLVDLRSSADPDLAKLAHAQGSISALVSETPIDVHIAVPRRDVTELPVAIRPAGLHGAIELTASATGTLLHPSVVVKATAQGLTAEMPTTLPLDATATIAYDGARVDVSVRALRDGGVLLDSHSTVDVRSSDIVAGAPGVELPWNASSETKLVAFPLDSIAAVIGSPIEGCVSGVVSVRDLHERAALSAHLDAVKIRLGEAIFPTGKIDVSLEGRAFAAAVRLDQTDGYVEAKAGAAVRWGADVVPTIEKGQPVSLDLDAKQFRLAALLPFMEGTFAELDGRLDASVHAKSGDAAKAHAEGTVSVRGARFEIPAMGQQLKNGNARITVESDGTVRVDELGFDGTSGHIAVTGRARLDGLELTSAEAHVRIAQSQKIPVTIEGVSMGEAWGEVDVTAALTPDKKTMNIEVQIPTLHADLPDIATHAVQELEDEPTTKVGVHRASLSNAPGYQFVLLPLKKPDDPKVTPTATEQEAKTAYHVAVHLGSEVRVKRGTQVQVYLGGNPTLDLGAKTKVSGQLILRQGRLEVFGKRFTIESGSVAFAGDDPSNPEVVVTAGWDAPDGTKVFVDFVGPVKTGKVKLRAEPARTENEIVSLILFGSVDSGGGAAPASQESSATKAAAVGGGVATQGLNKAMSNLTDIDVQTRVDTTDSQNPRPELAVQISRKVTAEIAYNLGLPAPGQNPDKTLFILDYRFLRHWSMLTTFGDHGSSIVDFVWQYRY